MNILILISKRITLGSMKEIRVEIEDGKTRNEKTYNYNTKDH